MHKRQSVLAICNDIPEFYCDRLRDPEWSKRFIGTLWITELYEISSRTNFIVASGDVALRMVKSGKWLAKDILVVQDLDSSWGRQLIRFGAIPLLLTCFESPLYAFNFYDRIDVIGKKFKHIMAPIGALSNHKNLEKCIPLRFPSYSINKIPNTVYKASDKKRRVALIASNKYWNHQLSNRPSVTDWQKFITWAKAAFMLYKSKFRRMAEAQQLHDERYKIIEYFSKKNFISIYGDGWQDIERYPSRWKYLASIINWCGKVDEKHDILSSYQFTICMENTRLAGYTTEKIIDAIVAGSIPIYLGDPLINNIVPKEAFINLADFSNERDLLAYLCDLNEPEFNDFLLTGKNFLESKAGQQFSYEYFANWVMGLALEAT